MFLEINLTIGQPSIVNYDALKHIVEENLTTNTEKHTKEPRSKMHFLKSFLVVVIHFTKSKNSEIVGSLKVNMLTEF